MAEAEKIDLVTTYVVSDRGIVKGTDEALNDALAKGYRVLGVIPCAIAQGGQSQLAGYMTVTVVLSSATSTLPFPFKSA
jgi:hypothetical protein